MQKSFRLSLCFTCCLGLLALLYLLPVLFMIIGSLLPDESVLHAMGSLRRLFESSISLQNYRDALFRANFLRALINSLLICSLIVLPGLLINSLAGYALSRMKWWGRSIVFYLVLSLLIIPFEAIAVPLFYQISLLGWRNTIIAQSLPFMANAFSIYLFYTFFLGMPRELEDAARIDGVGEFGIFFKVIVPNAKPAYASAAIITFLMHWGVYLWPLLVTSNELVRPLPLAIASFYTLPPLMWGDILAFGVMMVAPMIVVFFLLQTWILEGISRAGIKN